MGCPSNLKYSKDHEWARLEGDRVVWLDALPIDRHARGRFQVDDIQRITTVHKCRMLPRDGFVLDMNVRHAGLAAEDETLALG